MATSSSHEVTQLLLAWSNGDESALDKLAPLVHNELHRIASRYIHQERPGHILQTTALIHEAYIQLISQKTRRWENRSHFYGVAAKAMRRILVNYARSQNRFKRGGEARKVSLDEAAIVTAQPSTDLIALDEALKALEQINPRQSTIVELRFFGGLSIEEAAEVLKLSTATVRGDWTIAKAWLHREISSGP